MSAPSGAGLDRPQDDTRPESNRLAAHTNYVAGQIGQSPDPRAAILELEDDRHFLRARQIDPKPALRRKRSPAPTAVCSACGPPRCSRPPLRRPGALRKRQRPTRAPASPPAPSTAPPRPSTMPAPARTAGHQPHAGPPARPRTDRHLAPPQRQHLHPPSSYGSRQDGTATACLASADRRPQPALALPRSRSSLARAVKAASAETASRRPHVAQFLTNALGVGDEVSQDSHPRVVFVRSASFRNWGWDWLQDKHIKPDRLVLPGVSLGDDTEPPTTATAERLPRTADHPDTWPFQHGGGGRGFAADYCHG